MDKIKTPYRVLAGLVSLAGFISFLICSYFLFVQFNWGGVLILFPVIWLTHLTFISAKSGLPPKYMLWATTKNEE